MSTTSHRIQIYLLCALALLSHCAYADDINCLGEFDDELVNGNLMIATSCTLRGTTVNGNVQLFAGGSLEATDAVINGKLEADTANFIDLRNTAVDGKIKLHAMVGDLIQIRDSTVDGNLIVTQNRSRLELVRNNVSDDLRAIDNVGGLLISDNVVGSDLECKRNTPEPEGANNNVTGKKKNQCRDLKAPEVVAEEPSVDDEPDDNTTADSDETNDPAPEDDIGEQPNGGITTELPNNELTPVDDINAGTGGGASIGPAFLTLLILLVLPRIRRQRRT